MSQISRKKWFIFLKNIQMTLLMFGNERNFCIQIYVDVDKKERERECFSLLQVLASWHWSLFVIINKHTAGGRAQKSLIKTTECRCWPLIDELAEGDEAKYWNISKNFFSHSFNKKNKTKKIRNIRFNAMTISEFPESWSNVDKWNIREGKWKDKNRYHRCSFGRPGPFWLASEWHSRHSASVMTRLTAPKSHRTLATQDVLHADNCTTKFNLIIQFNWEDFTR